MVEDAIERRIHRWTATYSRQGGREGSGSAGPPRRVNPCRPMSSRLTGGQPWVAPVGVRATKGYSVGDVMNTRPVVGMYAFRSADPRRLAAFWAEVMELPISQHSTDDLVMLDLDHEVGPVTWMFERDSTVGGESSRLGLDISWPTGDGWRGLADRAEKAGAQRKGEHELNGVPWIEMADLDGNPFRVFAPRPVEE